MRRISARHRADWFAGSRTLQAIAYWHSKRGTPVAKRPRTRRALSHHAEGHRPWWGGERIRTSTYDFVQPNRRPELQLLIRIEKGNRPSGECMASERWRVWRATTRHTGRPAVRVASLAKQTTQTGGGWFRRDLMVEDSSVDKLVRTTKSPSTCGYAFPRSARQSLSCLAYITSVTFKEAFCPAHEPVDCTSILFRLALFQRPALARALEAE